MGISAVVTLIYMKTVPLILVPQRLFLSINSFSLMAVPFFILAGYLMNEAGVTQRLVNLSKAFVGHFKGGLAHVNVLTSMFFAGISGSTSADAAAIGSMLIPAMKKDGYDANFSVGVTASSATIGAIIPPSLVMVVYGSLTDLSIGMLFLGGAIPGILIGFGQMGVVYLYALKRGYRAGSKIKWREKLYRIKGSVLALFAPVIIIGGIIMGIFTATEAGAIAAVYSFILGFFVYKQIKVSDIKRILVNAAVMTSVPMIIVATASIFGWILAQQRFSAFVVSFLLSLSKNPTTLFIVIVLMLFVIGLFVEALAAMIIFTPLLFPIAGQLGFDQIHFAVIIVITLLIGTITPPVGLQLYITCAIAQISVSRATAVWPFVLIMLLLVFLFILVPELVIYLPNLAFK
jgi:C4-dicarboxylate transporter DctM subunit